MKEKVLKEVQEANDELIKKEFVEKEFNLSEKERLFLKNQFWKKEEDIKEFIKRLKEEIRPDEEGLEYDSEAIHELINKLAGEKLT